MKISARYISLLLFTCLISLSQAQEAAYYEPESGKGQWSFGAFAGFTQFYGDVSERNPIGKWTDDETELNYGIVFGRKMNSWLTLRGQYLTTTLTSKKTAISNGVEADLSIDTKYDEFGIQGKMHLNPFIWKDREEKLPIQLYLLAGPGYATWDANLYMADKTFVNDPTEIRINQSSGSAVTFDLGVGVDIKVYKNWNIMLETAVRGVGSDKVDISQGGNLAIDLPFNISAGINYKLDIQKDEKEKQSRQDIEREQPEEEEREIAQTEQGQYKRLPGEGPDVLDFPANCKISKQRTTSGAQTQQQTPSSGSTSERTRTDRGGTDKKQSGARPDYNESSASAGFEQGIVFSVQILATSTPANISQFKQKHNITRQVRERGSGGIYRYVAGQFRHYDDAVSYSNRMKRKGIKGAFVVVFKDGRKIKLTRELKNR